MTVAVNDVADHVSDYNHRLTSAQRTRIIRWLNDERRFLLNVAGEAESEDLELMAATFDLVADEPLVPLPDDFYSIQLVSRLSGGSYIPSEKVERPTLREFAADEKTYGDKEFYHAIRSQHLDIRPIPDEDVAAGIQLDYYRDKNDWIEGGNIEPYWNRWVGLLKIGAARRADARLFDRRPEIGDLYSTEMAAFRNRFPRRDRTPKRMRDPRHGRKRRDKSRFGRTS